MTDKARGSIQIITDQTDSLQLAHHHQLPVFTRNRTEAKTEHHSLVSGEFIPYKQTTHRISESELSKGSQDLLIGLLRLGSLRQFPGGYGIDYAPLLKKGVWPQYTSHHIKEVGDYLKKQQADILIAPGISGHPIAAQYAESAHIPTLLLTKEPPPSDATYPEGSFKIPSYTGGHDVVIHPDPTTLIEMITDLVYTQLDEQKSSIEPLISLHIGVGDDIIDQGIMSMALGESAIKMGIAGVTHVVNNKMRPKTGDERLMKVQVEVVAFVTPIKKAYNHPGDLLEEEFGIRPFSGIKINALYPEERVIDVAGVGKVQFKSYSV